MLIYIVYNINIGEFCITHLKDLAESLSAYEGVHILGALDTDEEESVLISPIMSGSDLPEKGELLN